MTKNSTISLYLLTYIYTMYENPKGEYGPLCPPLSTPRYSATVLYKELQLLKLKDIYKLELAKFMQKLQQNKLFKLFYDNFVNLSCQHCMISDVLVVPITIYLIC